MSEAAFPVVIEPAALAELRRLIARKGSPTTVVRIGVKGGGCSGLEYMVRLDESPRETDLVHEADGITVVCDPKSAGYLEGATLRATGNLMGGGLAFDNPNSARDCGCGTSFTPKPRV